MATGLYVGTYNLSTGSIDWTNHYSYTALRGLVINDGLGATSDSATWIMRYPVSYVQSGNELPLGGQVFRIVIEDVKLFEGVISAPANRWLSGGATMEIDYTGDSYVRLLDRHLVVAKAREEESAGSRIKWMLNNFAEEFNSTRYIADGPRIPESDFDYVTVSSAIGNVANQVNYMWYIDFDKKIHFFNTLDRDAPITEIDIDADPCVSDTVGDVEVIQDASGVANVIILKDFSSKGNETYPYTQVADGTTSFFKLPLPPFSVEDTDVYVQEEGDDTWYERTVVADPLGTASEADIYGQDDLAYVCVANWGVRFPQNDMPGAGDKVKTDYNPEVPDRVIVVFDEDSILEMQRREGGDGHHELTISVSDFRVENDNPVLSLGHLILRRKAWPITHGTFTLRTQTYGEWKPGQTFTIISQKRDIFDVKQWVKSDYTDKNAVRVWVTNVDRSFEVHDDGIWEKDMISFTSQPWEVPA